MRFVTASSVSVPRPRKRRSSSGIEGGWMKTYAQSNLPLFLTISAPWMSMSRMQQTPLDATSSTALKEVP